MISYGQRMTTVKLNLLSMLPRKIERKYFDQK